MVLRLQWLTSSCLRIRLLFLRVGKFWVERLDLVAQVAMRLVVIKLGLITWTRVGSRVP